MKRYFLGLVQLEGLEMVSANCNRQLQDMDDVSDCVREQLAGIADIFAEYLDSVDSCCTFIHYSATLSCIQYPLDTIQYQFIKNWLKRWTFWLGWSYS